MPSPFPEKNFSGGRENKPYGYPKAFPLGDRQWKECKHMVTSQGIKHMQNTKKASSFPWELAKIDGSQKSVGSL